MIYILYNKSFYGINTKKYLQNVARHFIESHFGRLIKVHHTRPVNCRSLVQTSHAGYCIFNTCYFLSFLQETTVRSFTYH